MKLPVFGTSLVLFNVKHPSCSLWNISQLLIIVYSVLPKAIHNNKEIVTV